jgi:hypothetical protein
MSEMVTLDLPPEVARRARALAAATNRRMEDVVVEWLGRVAAEPEIEMLPDAEVLELTRSQLSATDQEDLSDLLIRQSELTDRERSRLDDLMSIYRRGLTRKARALQEAVSRGLIPRLNGNGR